MTESGTGWYLYAVGRDLAPETLGRLTGLREEPLTAWEHRGLVAAVSPVDLSEFGEEGLRRHLEDLAWLEEVARAHDAVVQGLAGTGTVAPARLATIFVDEGSLRRRLDEMHEALEETLDRVEGRLEWSVKGYAAPPPDDATDPTDAGGSAGQAAADTPGAGAAYLQRRREETRRRAGAEEAAAAAAERAHRALAEHAAASRRLAPQDPRLTGRRDPMTLNGAYLVDARSPEFGSVVAEVAESLPDVRLEASGPWPPYSFATLEQP